MAAIEFMRAIFERANVAGSRSTALQPLMWLTAMLIFGLIFSTSWGAPDWAAVLLGVLLVLAVILFLLSYAYFGIKNPDALRSEKYTLSKLAIEKNLIGDDREGLREIADETFQTIETNAIPDKEEEAE